jgi:hypothetical protein
MHSAQMIEFIKLTLRSVIQLLVIANVVPSSVIFHPDNGSYAFLRHVGSYKSHTASHLRIRHSS